MATLVTTHNTPTMRSNNAAQLSQYQLLEKVGDGTFGTVILAVDKTMQGNANNSNARIALKKMKTEYRNKDEGDREREVRTLRRLRHHKNIIRLYATFFENGVFYIAYEYMERNLLDVIRGIHQHQQQQQRRSFQQSGLPEHDVRLIMFQVFAGIDHLHKHGYFHRDMKPENILCSVNTGSADMLVKICDFGLAKEVRSAPPFTTYISTRWYRAPELLLSALNYSTPIDIWACGCIMFECYTGNPLFPGKTDIDMVHKICARLGDPKESEWPEGHKLIKKKSLKFPACTTVNFALLFNESNVTGDTTSPSSSSSSSVSPEAIVLIRNILRWNPTKRIAASQILRHAYFNSVPSSVRAGSSSSDVSTNHNSATPPTSNRTPTTVNRDVSAGVGGAGGGSIKGIGGGGSSSRGGNSSNVAAKKFSTGGDSSKRTSYSNNAAPARPSVAAAPSAPSPPATDNRRYQQLKTERLLKSNNNSSAMIISPGGARKSSELTNSALKRAAAAAGTVGGPNDTIYEYATSKVENDAVLAAAAAAAGGAGVVAAERFVPNGTAAVYHTTAPMDTNNNAGDDAVVPNLAAVGAGTRKADAAPNRSTNTKLLQDLFRDIDAMSDKTDETAAAATTTTARQHHHRPQDIINAGQQQSLINGGGVDLAAVLLFPERSKTTSPPKLLSHQQQRNDFVQRFDNLLNSTSNNDAAGSKRKEFIDWSAINNKNTKKNYNNAKQQQHERSNGGKFSLDELVSSATTKPPSTSSQQQQNAASRLLGDLYSNNNNAAHSLSLDGKRMAVLKKSSTEFALRNFPMPLSPLISSGSVGRNDEFFAPVTTDPLAALNEMLHISPAKFAKNSHLNDAGIISDGGSNSSFTGLNSKHSATIFDSKRKADAVRNNNNVLQQQQPFTSSSSNLSHLTDWSRKYPQWK